MKGLSSNYSSTDLQSKHDSEFVAGQSSDYKIIELYLLTNL